MAANEDRTAMWRTPLSTPIRSNENGFQDLFKHSEKLLASAVSICRLKGSVECQTGGIITVCEEMQRLLRLAFNETARLEKELKKQKQTYDEDISFLKERISYLEDKKDNPKTTKDIKTTKANNNERLPLKPSTTENTREDVHTFQVEKTSMGKASCNGPELKSATITNENPITDNEKNTPEPNRSSGKEPKGSAIGEHSITDLEDESDDLSLEVSVFDINKQSKQKNTERKTAKKNQQDSSNSKPRKTAAKKSISSAKPQSINKNKETKASEKKPKEAKSAGTKTKESKATESKAKGCKSAETKATKKRSNAKINDDEAEMFEESKDDVFDANDSTSSDVFLNPESGLLEMKESCESEANEEEEIEEQVFKCNTKKKEVPERITSAEKNAKKEQKTRKTNRKSSVNQKTPKKKITEAFDVESVPESPRSGPSTCSSPSKPLPAIPAHKEMEKENASWTNPGIATDEPEEMLGDMSFLIDISSMISSFVSNPDSKQLELPLMQARERADARKLASLFNLHISIGSKADNRSSLILSKMPNSKMPKPGKLDNLLSKLSIAAAKEAERLSSKARNKRKFSAVGDNTLLNEKNNSQTRKAGMSRNKKAKI